MTKILKKKFKNVLTKRTNDGIIRPSKRTREPDFLQERPDTYHIMITLKNTIISLIRYK